MPLYKSVTINNDTQLLVWQITESHDTLFKQVRLKDVCLARVEGMKSEQHQRGFLSVRMLLQEAGYSDFDLYYANDGKPHLRDGKNISITHSHDFSAIIISSRNTGIDMEMRRDKIIKIAHKFCSSEFSYLNPEQQNDYIRMLTVIWGVKEALFKMISLPGISFKQHIDVDAFTLEDTNGTATVTFEKMNNNYTFLFEEIEGFTLVCSFEAINL
ncbi:4'-phosphopantetheinyl transferase superfamily protein [Flavobacterium salilacus subsp. salilacus]|uniref:4'-phosphopantetheinyl transferase family protein n=1 Tax=Flavobacterium TaxID=237 RepID=UPI0010755882|nr:MULTISPECIES: 4'-phosphopantetheinyl transferase superfamily protein [Flavobacterium]KAF2515765.1 4'-phosphopantetheinyl transferase superfamily protein [Flavobacterium salilacus subsp. salilacus]MBE1615435.1 4'-phosphopantetheinyl transferase superfamily protein [Flavobacterium sp. SaA2.13]NDI99510.1 4'-phosphopantetheinyl transferase superfamily protein [Flavobacterium salilacus subsp. altitudinum]